MIHIVPNQLNPRMAIRVFSRIAEQTMCLVNHGNFAQRRCVHWIIHFPVCVSRRATSAAAIIAPHRCNSRYSPDPPPVPFACIPPPLEGATSAMVVPTALHFRCCNARQTLNRRDVASQKFLSADSFANRGHRRGENRHLCAAKGPRLIPRRQC